MACDAVVFDLDETLVVEHASVKTAFAQACLPAVRKHGVDAVALAEALRRHGRDLWRASLHHAWCVDVGISSWEGLSGDLGGGVDQMAGLRQWADDSQFRRTAWARALAECGVDDPTLAGELAVQLIDVRAQHHALFPESLAVLDALGGTRRLAMLTNGAPRIQRGKIEALDLERHFDAVVISGDVGIGKPDPRLFARVIDRLGVPADGAVMVGNSLAKDVGGAQAAGLRGVWINRAGADPNAAVRPDAEIRSLAELPDVLERL